MAVTKGKRGALNIGANSVAHLRTWSVDESAGTTDSTVMGDDWEKHETTLNSWSGSCDCYMDKTDTDGQAALVIGSSVVVGFLPEGDTTGNRKKSGTATVTSVTENGSHDGLVELSVSFTGNGPLTVGVQS
jgi:hypothetical protein